MCLKMDCAVCTQIRKTICVSFYCYYYHSRWGARLSVAGSSPLFGFVLLVTEVVVDDCMIGLLPTHHLLGLHTWPQVRQHETNIQKGHYKGPRIYQYSPCYFEPWTSDIAEIIFLCKQCDELLLHLTKKNPLNIHPPHSHPPLHITSERIYFSE